MRLKRLLVAFFVAVLLAASVAGPASAQQDGLVNVDIGPINVLNGANIGIVAEVVAQVCGLRVSNVALLAEQVDRSGGERTVCESEQGPVVISDN